MKDSFENGGVDMFSESKYQYNENGDMQKSVVWHDAAGTHTETTIIEKKVPAAGTIILTAVVFLLIGALIASMIFFARFAGVRSIVDAIGGRTRPEQTAPIEDTIPTPIPRETPAPGGNTEQGGTVLGGNIPELYKNNVGGVVIVQSYNGRARLSNLVGTGTGFCISDNGCIITNAHVVEDADTYQVVAYSGDTVDAKLIGKDVRTDIAVLRINNPSLLKVLETGDSSAVQTGDFVFAIGHPTGDELSFTATFGMVGAVNRSVIIDGMRNNYIQIDAAINPGNSGGPLFDMNGRVIGVNSAKTVIASYDEDGEPINAEGLGFAIPINTALEMARSIIATGSIVRPGIGISTIAINEDVSEQYSIPRGALVYTITEDGPGHHAGLHVDDIITKADSTVIEDSEGLAKYISSRSVGDVVVLTVFRDGETVEINITIGDLNELGSTVLNGEYGGEKYGLR